MSDMGSGPPDPNPPTLAATVVCLRDGVGGPEVLLLRRRSRGAFAGLWVFPGGKVDAADARPDDTDQLASCRRAAVRESAEEAGMVLSESSLVTLSWWLPPVEAPRRFSTWFFLAPAPSEGSDPIVLSQDEVGEHRWVRPADAMAGAAEGDLPLAPPTWMTLWGLAGHRSVAEALDEAGRQAPERYLTRAAAIGGRMVATLWEGDVAYDDLDVDPSRAGPRRRLRLDTDPWQVEIDVPGPAAVPGDSG